MGATIPVARSLRATRTRASASSRLAVSQTAKTCGQFIAGGRLLPLTPPLASTVAAELIANVSETVATSFVSAFVDHRSSGDVLWLSALNEDRCKQQCGTGVLAIRSTDLRTFTSTDIGYKGKTCNTEVAGLNVASPSSLPPHKYVMILEPFTFLLNNNADGDLTHGWTAATGSKSPHAPGGGPSIRFEDGHYFVITGGQTVMLCRSKDLGASDPWNCQTMIAPPFHPHGKPTTTIHQN
eukprot:COSAG02_NODE_22042_length_765_cov_1.531532_1_plen_238_part_01